MSYFIEFLSMLYWRYQKYFLLYKSILKEFMLWYYIQKFFHNDTIIFFIKFYKFSEKLVISQLNITINHEYTYLIFVIEIQKQYSKTMFESKMTTRSGWGQITSINSSCAPGFVPIPCPTHHQYSITNICKAQNCIQPLCPQCIANHVQLHQQSKKPAKIQNIITTRTTCIEQLARMKYQAQKQIQECIGSSSGNIQQFLDAHHKRLDTAYKKILKIVDDMFMDMNKQMQVIAAAYLAQKEKKQKQAKTKLSPINDYLARISQYKQQLESDDYIPVLIQLLNDPPKKPKYDPLSETQNYGSVQVNQKYLQDIKTDITKFVKVVVNCKDQGFKGRLQMNKSQFNGSNNMKFSRFDRSRSRDTKDPRDSSNGNGSQSRLGQTRRSNSKKKIFGCESVISNISPITNTGSRTQLNNNNSIYQTLNQNQQQQQQGYKKSSSYPATTAYQTNTNNLNNNRIGQSRYSSYSTPIKISKSSYFINNNAGLWYFKQNTKSIYKASLQSIQAGFQRLQIQNINFIVPDGHRTVILPTGAVYMIGGQVQISQNQPAITLNKIYRLNQQELTLKQMQPMLQPRSLFGVCLHQDCIYVAGGLYTESINNSTNKYHNKTITNKIQKYSIRQNKWVPLSNLPQASYNFTMHALNTTRILKLGGITESRTFINKIDIYNLYDNTWNSIQPDNRFILTSSPGIVQVANDVVVVFGGMIATRGEKISKCYVLAEEDGGSVLAISEGPELYNQATFENAYLYEGAIVAIQNNQNANRNKLIMGFKYDQWKFVAC